MDPVRPLLNSSSQRRGGVLLMRDGETMFGGWKPIVGIDDGKKKRPRLFFTSVEEILEEEYYFDEQPEKKRRLTQEQLDLLERSFEEENKLEPERKNELAKKLGVQPRQVAIWFQNRRARSKTKQLEKELEQLKSSYNSLLADHHSVLKDNDRLHSEVACLTKKLHEAAVSTVDSGEQLLKFDDCLSTGGGGSGGIAPWKLVREAHPHQLVDICDFPDSLGCIPGLDNDDGCSYLGLSEFLKDQQDHTEVESLSWWG